MDLYGPAHARTPHAHRTHTQPEPHAAETTRHSVDFVHPFFNALVHFVYHFSKPHHRIAIEAETGGAPSVRVEMLL
jgi:hypothetical protein